MSHVIPVIESDFVRKHLTYKECIPAIRQAMTGFSKGKTRQHLRSVLAVGEAKMFGLMPGAMDEEGVFGAKLISVFKGNFDLGKPSHQGVIVLFETAHGSPLCVIEAGSVTAIRTAAASAAATDALARKDASSLALLGYGEQAFQHALAIKEIRDLRLIQVWGRSAERTQTFAERLSNEVGAEVRAAETAQEAVQSADMICTVTSAQDPILFREWVKPGAHINAVGSSVAEPAEIDNALVRDSRFIADSREGVLAQGGEFLRAKAAGLVADEHVLGEIGEVYAGDLAGRRSADDITIYKSLGHIAQDLAAAALIMKQWAQKRSDF